MIKLYFDVMLAGTFLFQVSYLYCPAFKLDLNEVLTEKVYKRMPSLKTQKKLVELFITENRVL